MDSLIPWLDPFRQVTFPALIIKILMAVFFGGLIGLERGQKHRAAGSRTYMIVCLGAALTMILSQYEANLLSGLWAEISDKVGIKTDVSRFGAQVINGIGFLGAGTIIVTGRQEVKGLTTAAGLWTCAIIGLAIGAGYYEAAVIATLVIVIAEIFFVKFEYWVLVNSRNLNIYVEYEDNENLDNVIRLIKGYRIVIIDLEITKSGNNACAIFQLQLPKKISHDKIMTAISTAEGIVSVEEL